MTIEKSSAGAPGGIPATTAPGTAAESEADQVRRLMNGLLSMLSHDLRTPLSAMSGWLFLLESDKLDAAGRKRALGKIKSNIDEQVQLLDDVLLLSRCKTGHLELDLVPTLAMLPLSAAMDAARAAASAGNVALQGPAGADTRISADAERLRRAFELLLTRAIRSTPSGGAVTAAVQSRNGAVEISISDTGRGINPAALPYLLNPLARADDSSGRAHGMDRGLLLAQALVEAHHGRMRIDSGGEGTGAIVTVELPARDASG